MDKKVWLLTCGQYSDYHVVGVFDDEKRANEIKDHMNQMEPMDEYRLEPMVLNKIESDNFELGYSASCKVHPSKFDEQYHNGIYPKWLNFGEIKISPEIEKSKDYIDDGYFRIYGNNKDLLFKKDCDLKTIILAKYHNIA